MDFSLLFMSSSWFISHFMRRKIREEIDLQPFEGDTARGKSWEERDDITEKTGKFLLKRRSLMRIFLNKFWKRLHVSLCRKLVLYLTFWGLGEKFSEWKILGGPSGHFLLKIPSFLILSIDWSHLPHSTFKQFRKHSCFSEKPPSEPLTSNEKIPWATLLKPKTISIKVFLPTKQFLSLKT